MTESLSASFGRPFAEQIAALERRLQNLVGTVAWDDLRHAQHEQAFVVAGAMKAELLADLGEAVRKAVGEHRSLEQFRADFRKIVAERGWHGWKGEGTAKGEAWRTRVIYRTNMATSYASGRMAQLLAANYKFWIYKHGNALEPRLQHLAWDGLALPPEHPFWQTHAPPNGWGCTCRIRGADSARGIIAAKGDPNKKLPDGWDVRSPKTGTPPGIDKGWDYPVGLSSAEALVAAKSRAATLPTPIGENLLASIESVTPDPDTAEAMLARLFEGYQEADAFETARAIRQATLTLSDELLSHSQRMALNAYSRHHVYEHLNAHLRDLSTGGSGLGEDWREFARLLDGSLERLPFTSGLAKRGIVEPSERLLGYFRSAQMGEQFEFAAFSSFTADPTRAFQGSIQFVVQSLFGRNVSAFSHHKSEMEVLFRRGTQFRILARTGTDDQMIIWIEEVRAHRYSDLPLEALHAEQLG